MNTDIAEARIRLSSSADVVEAVPFLFGFQPANSLVVLSLRGRRSRLGMAARIDLADPSHAATCARDFVGYLERDSARRAIVVLYPPCGGLAHPSVEPLATAMTDQLDEAGIEVCELLCVCDGRWWSLLCANDGCCPPEGTLVNQGGTSANVALLTVQGHTVAASRDELARSLEPVTQQAAAEMAQVLPAVRDRLVRRVERGEGDEVAAETASLFSAAVGSGLRGADGVRPGADPSLGVAAIARLIAGLDDKYVRDGLLSWFDGDRGQALRRLLIELVRRGDPLTSCQPLTTLAWLCYLQGDGTFAGIALDRALIVDPGCELAKILDAVLAKGVNPEVFQEPTRALGGLLCLPRIPSGAAESPG